MRPFPGIAFQPSQPAKRPQRWNMGLPHSLGGCLYGRMATAVTARQALRNATSGHHERVDAIFSTAALDARGSYARFLRAQAAAHLPVERALEQGGVAALISDWPARRRRESLESDLEALGEKIPPAAGNLSLDSDAALLGALYVLEGSRLGASVLKRSVPPEFPMKFLGGVDSAAWRSLLQLLDERLRDEADLVVAIRAARDVFVLFETAGAGHLQQG